jgi:UDP-glucose 4-epimerase
MIGPEWAIARQLSHIAGAPVPEHVIELMHRGRLADGGRAEALLGIKPRATTSEVIDRLYRWESVVRVPPQRAWEVA